MINKRIIFSLLYSNGYFFLSRNFRLQKIGDLNWLMKNYSFHETCQYIDELAFLLVTKKPSQEEINRFFKDIDVIKSKVFAPIMIGGYLRKIENIKNCFKNGADKILINTASQNKEFINEVSEIYGSQAITIMVDYKKNAKMDNNVFIDCGTKNTNLNVEEILNKIKDYNFGEIILHSMDRDGTGNGCDLDILKTILNIPNKPLLLMGGAGKPEHIIETLDNENIYGVVTANLLNFIGNGLKITREIAIKKNVKIAKLA